VIYQLVPTTEHVPEILQNTEVATSHRQGLLCTTTNKRTNDRIYYIYIPTLFGPTQVSAGNGFLNLNALKK